MVIENNLVKSLCSFLLFIIFFSVCKIKCKRKSITISLSFMYFGFVTNKIERIPFVMRTRACDEFD